LVIAIGGRQAAQTQTMAQVQDLLGSDGREFVQGMLESATLIGAVTCLVRR
jgi:hypothetical protein